MKVPLNVVIFSLVVVTASAWSTIVGSTVSGFGGRILTTTAPQCQAMWTMKKGKAVPPQMRSQYARQREMVAQREQMMAASKPGADGLPVFNLFVRTPRANVGDIKKHLSSSDVASFVLADYAVARSGRYRGVNCWASHFSPFGVSSQMWYPCGTFKGDERSKALCKSYADGGLLAGISKKQIDAGIAGSLWQDQGKLKEAILKTYPQLKKSKDQLEFGYRLGFEGLSEEQTKETKVIVPKEQKGFVDNIKNIFS